MLNSIQPLVRLPSFALAILALVSSLAASEKPNVLLILVDDYGYADISAEGNTQIATPNIDRIAHEGMRFSRFYQSAGACAPTRASLLTGRYYYETGVWGVHWGRDFLNRDEHTLGDLMHSAGYRTGVFGKWHSGKTDAYFGWSRGFDTSVHTELYQYHENRILADRRLVTVDRPITDVVGDRAAAFIASNADQPFFCYVPFQAVHESFNCPEPLFEKYKDLGYSNHVAALYGMIEVLDNNVGQLLDTIDSLGLTENTLVLFLVDDGSSPGFLNSYQTRRMNKAEQSERRQGWARELRGTKANIWEGGQISPFYARWPGVIEPGSSSDALSSIIDIYPTLADIAAIPYPESQLPLRGTSLKPSLLGKQNPKPDRILFDGTNLYLLERERSFKDGQPRIRQLSAHYKNWKYIREDQYIHGGKDAFTHKLYNLDTDPTESNNCFDAHPDIAGLLKTSTELWFTSILVSGRGFQETVFPVGNWNETATPINLDATTKIVGSLQRPGSGFHFTGWTQVGNALHFNIDVIEAGTYRFELDHSPDNAGSRFEIAAGDAVSTCQITSGTQSLSTPASLQAGLQTLRLTLTDPGNDEAPLEWLRLLVVHRIPNLDTPDIPREIGFTLSSSKNGQEIALGEQTFETREFLRSSDTIPTGQIKTGYPLEISPYAANPESVAQLKIWLGFDLIQTSRDLAPTTFDINTPGRHSLTLEFISETGSTSTSRIELIATN
ncbi:sulfatase-like hydrolase/transferase [Pelagicoccus sp. SDUM812005]|uniref:sulfatase-like hydrolase/transferase n=1 Tax=Pelagicoccus sp. SDUM812005 TaxID=3041257 RepID=UPI00280CEDB5|nr:sulfatase-like hydrolase/transferase [Pelagicoccus sp. SDUM812005]MDQ8180317.1 sulfatase-like hydrolase/transferase [Pelagicoccus sp. SDUM812005]